MVIKFNKHGKLIWSDGHLQVWEAEKNCKKASYIVCEPQQDTSKYTTVLCNISGCQISPVQALALYRGEPVEHNSKCFKNLSLACTLVPESIITEKMYEAGNIYYNQILKVNVAWHKVCPKSHQVLAYLCNDQILCKNRPGRGFEAEISASDCFELLKEGYLRMGNYFLPYEILESEIQPQWEISQAAIFLEQNSDKLPQLSKYQKQLLVGAGLKLEGQHIQFRRLLMLMGREKFEAILLNIYPDSENGHSCKENAQ